MLLKSVGQDEGILGEAIKEKSDAADELGRLTKEMEPSLKQDDKMEDNSNIAQPVSPPDHVIDRQEDSTQGEHNNVACTSEAKRDDPPDFVCSGEINSNLVVGVILSEETAEAEKKCDDEYRMEVENSVNKSPTDNMKEISSVSTVHIEMLNVENASFENVDALPKDKSKEMLEHDDQSKDSTVADQILSGTAECTKKVEYPPCADTRVESLIEQKVEIEVNTSEDPSGSPVKEDHHLHLLEESKSDMNSIEPSQHVEAVVCTADPEICDQLEGSAHEGSDVICQGNRSPKEKVVEVDSTKVETFAFPEEQMDVAEEKEGFGSQVISLEGQNIEIFNKEAGISSCPELEMDSVVEKDKLLESNGQVDTNVLAEGVVVVDHKAGKWGVETAKDLVGDVSSLTGACSSTELLTEQPPNEDLIPNDYKLPLTYGESVQPKGKELFSEEGGVHNCDQLVAFQGNQNEDLQTESIDKECKVVGSLVSDECDEENIIKTHGSESSRVTKEPASNTDEKNPNLSFCNTLNGGTGLAVDVDTSLEQKPEAAMMSMEADNKYAMEIEGHNDTGRLCLKESLQVENALEPAIEDRKDAANQNDQVVAEAGKECSKKLEISFVPFNSTVEHVCGTEGSDSENHNTMLVERNAEAAMVQAPESMAISTTEPFLDQRQKNHEATVALTAHTTVQIDPSTKDAHQASVAPAHPSKYGSDSLNEGGGTVYPIEDCEKQQLEIKETATESVQPFKAIGADGTDKSLPLNSGNEATSGHDSFTFDVCPSGGPSERKTSAGFQSMPNIQIDKVQMDIKKSPLTSSSTQIDRKMLPEVSHVTPQPPIGGIAQVGVKGTPERKTRRVSGKTTVRSAKKRNNAKETTPVRQSDKGDTSLVFMNTPGRGQLVQFEELKRSGDVARSGAKPSSFLPIPTSNLLDLNSSVPTAAFFPQPFTEFQQVQLRAQIIVYGSLIQDSSPDEACMISAFGSSEGSRTLWEPAWRACVERVQAQKSHASKLGTPIQSHSGSKAPVQPVKHSALQNKVLSSPAGRVTSKGIPSSAVTPIIPLSSPLWNVSTPSDGWHSSGLPRGGSADCHQPLSPLHPYQVPGITNVVGHSPSWLSQSPFTSPWMASPQTSTFDANFPSSVFPNTEPTKITPAKDSSVAGPSFPTTKHASFPAVVHDNRGAAVSVSASAGPSQPFVNKVAAIPRSADSKPRKRKKVPATEGLGQIPFLASNQGASVCSPGVGSHLSPVTEIVGQKFLLAQSRTESVPTVNTLFSTSVAVTAPDRFTSASNSGKFPATTSPILSRDQLNRADQNVEKKSIVSEETSDTVEEAKLHAETAASHAANAVSHYHDVWSQLARQKNSGLISDVDAKLASAAVAITAATSVAKAAAAAAKIASNVAVQAKLMADEVSSSSVNVDPTQSNSSGKATSSTVLNSGDGNVYPSSIIAVAREAAKKRVEAASAASKHAENLDAIVKAAELAAEAVSQAGKILSIGDSMPLSKLEELGPVGTEKGTNKQIVDSDQPKAFSIELYNFSTEESKGGSSGVEETKKSSKLTSLEKASFGAQRGHRASELAEITGRITGVIPEPKAGLRTVSVIADDAYANASGLSIENGMKEGCLVEVFKDDGSCKAAWYSANILNLKDGKAFVCYTDLQVDDGTGLLKEWVPLQSDSISTPTIRIAHPLTRMQFDGTRRKRKAALMDYFWSVGDRVDAWMQDCWREGVVKEKNKNDETALTILFPALGNTSVVRAWHLRPTLTWQDGKWIEWSSPRHHSPFEGDGPQEKRVRLGSPIEAKGKDKVAGGVDLIELRKRDEAKLQPLAENELEFNTGNNTTHENKLESRRTVRTGLQKEGSRVVFGVPKPGKKRKFMDVSKHFDTAQGSKNIRTGESFKFGKNVTPQISGTHGWKNSTKIDVIREKQAAEDKPKVLRSGKPPSASSRALPRKDNISTSVKSTTLAADKMSEEAISSEENDMGQQNMMEFGSVSDSQDTSEGQTLASSLDPPKVARRKGFSSHARSERLNKGKSVPSSGKMGKKVELHEKSVPEVAEPRRSNRRIQPTSRLLEGLQSSLSISKIPFSHDKTHRSQSRSKF